MVEPRRLESVPVPDAADRDSQAEALLVGGLDHYFNGQFDEAIHLWTRVLFIDRTHARARAYIDRARSALAERQRKSEELLQTSRDLLDQGQTAAARHFLTEAVAASGEDEHASALRVRLERLERVHAAERSAPPPTPVRPEAVPAWSWQRRSRLAIGAITVLAAGAIVVALTNTAVQDWLGVGPVSEGLRPTVDPVVWPVLSSSDVALVRARTLFDRGRLAEALQVLERVSADSSVRSAADALRIEIQQLLLATGPEPSGGRPAAPIRR